MGWFTFLKRTAASVPTPSAGKVSVFVNSATGEPSYKDDAGTTTSLKGATGAAGGVTSLNGKTGVVSELQSFIVACSDESTALTAGTSKVTFRMPYAFTVTAVRCSLSTTQTSGSIFTVDINESGTSILSTKLTIDNTEDTSVTAATAAVISDSSLADNAKMTVDIDQIGDGTAKGLKVAIIGYPT